MKAKLSLIILLILTMTQVVLPFSTNAGSVQSRAKNAADSVSGLYSSRYGSPESIRKAVSPLLSSARMTTLNGKISFNARIECPDPYPFLQILFQPTTTNDFHALITQDTNGDGKYDYQVKTPLISGVCTNGFISCDAGTWNNCHYYKWVLNTDGTVTWVKVGGTSQLGTCFCINNSCGGNVFQQFPQIADTFGEGLAQFIAAESGFAISNVNSKFPLLTYFGDNAKDCSLVSGGVGQTPSTLMSYYKNSSALDSAKESVAASQEQNKQSPYYLVVHSEYMRKNPVSVYECTIKRQVYLTELKWITDGGYNFTENCQSIKKIGNNLYRCYLPSTGGGWGGCGHSWRYYFSGTFIAVLYSPDDFAGIVEADSKKIFERWTHTDATTPETHTIKYTVSSPVWVYAGDGNTGACNGVAGGNFSIYLKRYEKLAENKEDGCLKMEQNPDCKLEDEQVCDYSEQNCVYTIKDYNPTGVTLLKQCHKVEDHGAGLTWDVCVNGNSMTYVTNAGVQATGTVETGNDVWWVIKRTYTCKVNLTVPSAQREQNIEENGNYANGVILYPDKTTEVHGIGGYSGTFEAQVNPPQNYGQCQYTCVVTKPEKRTNAISGGAQAINASSPSGNTTEKEFLPCKKDAYGNWYCPASGDETILQPCTCLDMGARSIAVFSAATEAAKDLTCSKE